MENASKALLIAGGVLIAILVASLGVYFWESFSEQTARIAQQMENDRKTEFNQQFMKYNGMSDLRIHDVITLINLAKDSNISNQLTNDMAPTTPEDTTSSYITVRLNATKFDTSTNPDLLKDRWCNL